MLKIFFNCIAIKEIIAELDKDSHCDINSASSLIVSFSHFLKDTYTSFAKPQ